MSQHDRRTEPRYRTHRPVRITLPDGSGLNASTADISAGGLRVHCPQRLPAGIHLTLEIAVGGADQALTLWSHVQHCTADPQHSGFSLGLRHRNTPSPYLGLLRNARTQQWQKHH
ncbi:PilZ domain-containing protein [Motiliproteus sediminis]|uniref:PilZ domain-containing protein n=1 Tax=Motiliproteus sediminis TaxID=1468178 RepID=UPI001AEF4D8F|nr:PilZ domain-containing protein [Motiliproteus sediminis]